MCPDSNAFYARIKAFLLIVFGAVILVSCTPFSKEIISRVDDTVTIAAVRKNPEQFKGKMVLWGGVIIETENSQDESKILVLQTALNIVDRPLNLDRSEGRFIVKEKGFFDPVIFARGREITVAGQIIGKEDLPLGKIRYEYPVIVPAQFILWERPEYYYPLYYTTPYFHAYPVIRYGHGHGRGRR
ncbi:MAG: Slp family lipoprotein [Syntrophales bacterium]|nr:Slp family lipoprotein [Syntrophales bacterium]